MGRWIRRGGSTLVERHVSYVVCRDRCSHRSLDMDIDVQSVQHVQHRRRKLVSTNGKGLFYSSIRMYLLPCCGILGTLVGYGIISSRFTS